MSDARDILKKPAERTEGPEPHTEKLLAEVQQPVPKFGKFAMDSGLILKRAGDQMEFHLRANGHDETIFSVDYTPEGFEKAKQLYQDRVDKTMNGVTAKYGVEFSKENEDAVRMVHENADGKLEKGKMLKARAPTLPELAGIEAALSHSEPSYTSRDGKHALKFYFLKESYSRDPGEQGAIANYIQADERGLPAVLIAPGEDAVSPPTDKDRPFEGEYSIESLVTHELAHNSQRNLDWEDESNHKFDDVCKTLGWAPYEIPETHQGIWIIKLKSGDLYKLGDMGWVKTDEQGNPVDKNGKRVDKEDQAATLPISEIRKQAVVTPATDYFDNPLEEDAEAKMLFRMNPTRRAGLLKTSPVLYDFEKQQDQLEIDVMRGKSADGNSKLIRALDGSLVENSEANRKIIADFEQKNRPTQ